MENKLSKFKKKQAITYVVTFKRVRVTIAVVEKQYHVYYIIICVVILYK